jgi:hypothetical protein
MSSAYDFGVRAFGCNIQVTAECPETLAMLERYVFPSLRRVACAADTPDIFIRVVRFSDEFQLLINNVVVQSACGVIRLVPELIRALDEAVIQRLTRLHAVHAGAVQLGERVLLLPGVTHSVKSSLVAELLRRGAIYFSDEYALIDSEGRVYPYPRPLLLRNGSPEQFPVLPWECNSSIGTAPAPVGWILSLEYQPKCRWSVAAMPQSEALLTLLRNTPHVLAESPDLVGIFRHAVAGAACYSGRRTEAADAADQILQLIGTLA